MFRAEREKIILDLVNSKGIVSLEELMEATGVSKATAHRYINELDEMKQLEKIRGGVRAISTKYVSAPVDEPPTNTKNLMNREEKQRIARAALNLLQPGEQVILDSGTTVLELAKLINRNFEATVITNDARIAMELGAHKKIEMLLIGGMIRTGYYSSYGYFAESMLNSIAADKLFFSADAISPDFEIMNYNMNEVNMKKICVSKARERILLCDHSKFAARALVAVETIDSVDTVIVGRELDESIQNQLRQLGKRLILA